MPINFRRTVENSDGTITIAYPVPDGVEYYDRFGLRAPIIVERWNCPDDCGAITVLTKITVERYMLGRIK